MRKAFTSSPRRILFPMKAKMKKALRTQKAAMKNGFLSNRMKELKKNRTKDSSCTRISILTPAHEGRGKNGIKGRRNLVRKDKKQTDGFAARTKVT